MTILIVVRSLFIALIVAAIIITAGRIAPQTQTTLSTEVAIATALRTVTVQNPHFMNMAI